MLKKKQVLYHFILQAALIGLLYRQLEILLIEVNSGWAAFWHPFVWLRYAISSIIIYFIFSIIIRIINKKRYKLYFIHYTALFLTGFLFIWIGLGANVNLVFIHGFEVITTTDWIVQLGINLLLLLVPFVALSVIVLNKTIKKRKNKLHESFSKFAKISVPTLVLAMVFESVLVSLLLRNPITNSSTESAKPLNVILISVDTLRKDHLSLHGYPRRTSPNLDKFFKQGIRFERCIATLPATAPNYTSIYTGTYHLKHFVTANGFSFRPELNQLTTLAQELKENGYYCSSHMTGSLPGTGTNLDLGIDDLYQRSVKVVSSGGFDLLSVVGNLFAYIDSALDHKYMNRRLGPETAAALKWIEDGIHEPFYVHFYWHWPHDPYGDRRVDLTEGFFDETVKYEPFPTDSPSIMSSILQDREKYDSDIFYTDIQIRVVLDALKQNGYMDNSIVIFTADHGEDLGERYRDDKPFFGHAHWLYESSICVPLIFVFPTKELSDQKADFPVSSVDIFPTVLRLLQLPIPDTNQGEILFKGSLGSLSIREELASLRPFVFSFNCTYGEIKPDFSSIFDAKYTYHHMESTGEIKLFDILADYHSTQNIVRDYPEIADTLQKELDTWLKKHEGLHIQMGDKIKKVQDIPARLKEKLRALGYIK